MIEREHRKEIKGFNKDKNKKFKEFKGKFLKVKESLISQKGTV